MLRRVAQGWSEVTNAEPGQGALHAVDKPRAFLDQALSLPIGSLGVLFGNRWHARHAAMAPFATQPPHEPALQQLGVEPIGLCSAMFSRYRHTRGMDHVRLDPTRREPARQPEAVAAGFEGNRKDIVLKSDNRGRVTRVRDVGRVEVGAADYGNTAYMDRSNAAALLVYAEPGANSLAVEHEVLSKMEELKKHFPPGVDATIVYDPNIFIAKSIKEVVVTIFVAILLVVGVVFLFLQNWRATIIPVIAIPVSLVGTFTVLALFGISLNNLSLFGLVLAVGIVVDDAIVVVENVERNMRDGMSPLEAAHRTMDEVGGALISIALTLCAVFVPSAFLSGISGLFFRQFAVTISASTVISCFVSLTLSPA